MVYPKYRPGYTGIVEPMLASAVDHLPTGESLLYEPKWDGFRCLAETGPVRLTSKQGRLLSQRFPEIVDALAAQLSRLGMRQLHVAETEKYAHVTYFFNGGVEEPFAGEDRILVPSNR